jgi:hypothetical protein
VVTWDGRWGLQRDKNVRSACLAPLTTAIAASLFGEAVKSSNKTARSLALQLSALTSVTEHTAKMCRDSINFRLAGGNLVGVGTKLLLGEQSIVLPLLAHEAAVTIKERDTVLPAKVNQYWLTSRMDIEHTVSK